MKGFNEEFKEIDCPICINKNPKGVNCKEFATYIVADYRISSINKCNNMNSYGLNLLKERIELEAISEDREASGYACSLYNYDELIDDKKNKLYLERDTVVKLVSELNKKEKALIKAHQAGKVDVNE